MNDTFTNARENWNEIYGKAIASKRTWRTLCFILSIAIIASIAGIVWIGSQSKITPYVIVLDETKRELYSGLITKSSKVTDIIVKRELELFVKKMRLASLDKELMMQNMDWVFAHLLTNTNSYKKLTKHFQDNNPFELIKKQTRLVEKINSALPITKNTWSVEWTETVRNVDGEILETQDFKGIFTLSKKNPETKKQWSLNPFGLWIIDISWEIKK